MPNLCTASRVLSVAYDTEKNKEYPGCARISDKWEIVLLTHSRNEGVCGEFVTPRKEGDVADTSKKRTISWIWNVDL
jgi:hypothetical protein